MPLTIIDFIEQVDGVSTEDIPFDEREQINDALADLTGGPGGIGAPVNDDAILVSKNLNGREGFGSIQDAVDSGGAGTGDTIFVEPGEYEPVNIDVGGLRLEGPNAGIAGDSDERGAEATITDANGRLVIEASNVTIDGFNFEFDESAIQSKSGKDNLITNSRFELTGTTSDTYAIRVGGGSPGTDVTNSLFTDIVSSDGVSGDNVNGVVVTDPRDTRVANNVFSSVDTAVNAGDKSPEAGTLVVENNEFSDITQFGAVALVNGDAGLDADINNNTIESSRIGIGVFAGSSDATFSIQDNDFQNFANDEVFVDDSAGVLTLDNVLNNQSNTFDPDGQVVGNQIRVNGTAPADTVVNLDSDDTFTGTTAIQDAVNDANTDTGDTIRVGPGTFTESVTINTDGLTLEGPNAGIAGDSDERGAEATITGKVNIGDQSDTTLSGEIVINGIEMATTDSGVTDGVVSVGDRQQKVEDVTITNSVIDTDLSQSAVGVGIYTEEVDNLVMENNAFTESGSGTSVAYNAAESPVNTIEMSENTLTDVDRLYNEGAGFIEGRGISSTTVNIVDNDVNGATTAIGIGDSEDALETVDYVISGNEIEASSVGIIQNGGTPASFTIENNDFTGGSDTTYIEDSGGILNLSVILNDQGNTFDPAAEIGTVSTEGGDINAIVPESGN